MSYDTLSNQDNILDKIIGVQSNKNQLSSDGFPKELMYMLTHIKQKVWKEIKQYFQDIYDLCNKVSDEVEENSDLESEESANSTVDEEESSNSTVDEEELDNLTVDEEESAIQLLMKKNQLIQLLMKKNQPIQLLMKKNQPIQLLMNKILMIMKFFMSDKAKLEMFNRLD